MGRYHNKKESAPITGTYLGTVSGLRAVQGCDVHDARREIPSAVARAGDEDEDARDHVQDEREREDEPELEQPRDERARRLGDLARDVMVDQREDCGGRGPLAPSLRQEHPRRTRREVVAAVAADVVRLLAELRLAPGEVLLAPLELLEPGLLGRRRVLERVRVEGVCGCERVLAVR
jgi:hypothetical protein